MRQRVIVGLLVAALLAASAVSVDAFYVACGYWIWWPGC